MKPAPRYLKACYFRAVDGRKVDFLLVENRRPIRLIECKHGDAEPHPGLLYLRERFPRCDAFQISAVGRKDYVTPTGIRVCPAVTLLRELV